MAVNAVKSASVLSSCITHQIYGNQAMMTYVWLLPLSDLSVSRLPALSRSLFLTLIAWVQTRQEEHFILQSFNNLWMADYKLM